MRTILTADYRIMLEAVDSIIYGIKLLKSIGVEKVYVGIEDNKPGHEMFRNKLKGNDIIEDKPSN